MTTPQMNNLKLINQCEQPISKDIKEIKYFYSVIQQEGLHHTILCDKNLCHLTLLKGYIIIFFHLSDVCQYILGTKACYAKSLLKC